MLFLELVDEFHISFTQASLLLGYQLLTVGATGIVVAASSQRFGKRPNFIISISIAWAGSLWGGAAQSYASLVGARVIQGLGIAMFESVTFAVIGQFGNGTSAVYRC